MPITNSIGRMIAVVAFTALAATGAHAQQVLKIFDSHLHYNGDFNAHVAKSAQVNLEFTRDLHHGDCLVVIAPVGYTPRFGELCDLMIFQAVQTSREDAPWRNGTSKHRANRSAR